MLKTILLWLMILFYLVAGFNHFYNPASYWRIIPAYMPFSHAINIAAGCFELLFGLMLIFPKTRTLAAYGIILMLIAFLPVHIDMDPCSAQVRCRWFISHSAYRLDTADYSATTADTLGLVVP